MVFILRIRKEQGGTKMAEIPQKMKFWLFGMGPSFQAKESLVVGIVAIIAIVLGIVSAATDNSLGLGSGNWFLLSIALFVWSTIKWLTAYFGAKEGYTR
jgi:hypothetical protein